MVKLLKELSCGLRRKVYAFWEILPVAMQDCDRPRFEHVYDAMPKCFCGKHA